jgi:hypothetical protein
MEATEKNNGLSQFTDKAIEAHRWTSFSPEKRGNQLIEDFNGYLQEDIDCLRAENITEAVILEYTDRFKQLFSKWLSAKSNCFSVMITGTSGVNLRKHEKANRSEQRHYEVFKEWRIRAKKAIIRKAKPQKTFLSEIERYKAELEGMKKNHELMKEANKKISQSRKTGEDITQYLVDKLGVLPHMIDWTLKYGFGLANNSANMRRVEQRIKEIEAKEQRAISDGQKEFPFDGFIVIFNYEADRIQIRHNEKPGAATIWQLKHNGFRWSPSFGTWQRQLNASGISAAEKVLNVKIRN